MFHVFDNRLTLKKSDKPKVTFVLTFQLLLYLGSFESVSLIKKRCSPEKNQLSKSSESRKLATIFFQGKIWNQRQSSLD